MKSWALSLVLLSFPALAETGLVTQVKLSPVGSFEAKTSKINGFAEMNGNRVSAKNVTIPVESVTTGISLRDKHMKEKLDSAQHPNLELIEASGEGGKGKAKIRMRGIEKEVSGTYKVIGGRELEARFPIKFSDFKVEGIRYQGVGVKDEAQVIVTLPLKKAP